MKTVAGTLPAKLKAVVDIPLQTVSLATEFTSGVGFTVNVKVIWSPVQLAVEGVTLTIDTTGITPALDTVNGSIFPEPDGASPMEVMGLAHV
jgi:hypothetical protein